MKTSYFLAICVAIGFGISGLFAGLASGNSAATTNIILLALTAAVLAVALK